MSAFRTAKLGYVELNVASLARSIPFYRDIVGLQFVEHGPTGEARFRCADGRYTVVLHEGAHPGFSRCGWMLAEEEQFERLHATLDRHDVAWEPIPVEECERRLLSRGTRLIIPHLEAVWEYYLPTAELEQGSFEPTVALIERLGHVVFRTRNYDKTVRFFIDVLGFRISDDVGDQVTLMRPFGSPYHHGVGLARSEKNVFHHLNFMVTEIDDIGRGLHRFNANDAPIVYGPGRHPASSSVFLYFLDPDGMTLEYSYGMEQFADEDYRDHRVLPLVDESSDSWGSPRDARMSQRGVVESYALANVAVETAD